MDPVDYRNATWDAICGRVAGLRSATYLALLLHGPCTTRDLARKSNFDLLTIRPRVTELIQLGFALLVEDAGGRGTEGTYRALSVVEAQALFQRRRAEALGQRVQGELNLVP